MNQRLQYVSQTCPIDKSSRLSTLVTNFTISFLSSVLRSTLQQRYVPFTHSFTVSMPDFGLLPRRCFSSSSVTICSGRMLMYSITLIIALNALLSSHSEKKHLKSKIIVILLLTALMFGFYFLAIVKSLIFSEVTKHRDHSYS